MDLSNINPILLVASIMISATPILLAAIGEMVVEKSGVLNLGVEGMMITGAVIGFVVAINSGSPMLGFAVAALAGAVVSLSFGVLTQVFLSNQVATGLGLTLVGLGLSSLIGKPYEGMKAESLPKLDIPLLGDLPVVGRMFFSHDIMVYLSLLLVVAVWAFLKYTRAGLILRAVGESHESAHALGYKVIRVRLAAIMFGGACAGLGGAYLQPRAGAAMDRGHDGGRGLDRAGHRGLCKLARRACFDRCVSFRRHHRSATQSAGRRSDLGCAVLVDVAISDNDPRACFHLVQPQPQQRMMRPRTLERRSMRPDETIGRVHSNGAAAAPPTGRLSMIRRTLLATAAAGLTLAFGAPAMAQDVTKACFVYVGPIGDGGWTYQHHQGALAVKEEFGDAVEIAWQESVPEGADAERVITQMALSGCNNHLHHVLRLYGPDQQRRGQVPGREVRARHRLQARSSQCIHL